MQVPPPLLLPLLRSPLQGELLAWLFLHPEDDFSAVELANRIGASASTVSREGDRLAAAGLVLEARRGNLRLLRANTETPISGPLAELLALTYGPPVVLARALRPLEGITEAFIYGSWAARYRGVPGSVPRDIDVLVVGSADQDRLFDAARVAEVDLGREVNVRRVSDDAWQHGDTDQFLRSVRHGPMVKLDLTKDVFA